ncbi:MAG: hypothetical protein ACOYJI_00425 [Anaerovoracaceae bacterium]|jgi:hypothetical protein
MERILSDLLDWRMQFENFKTLILTGSSEKDRMNVIRQFAAKNFESMVHVNLRNNEKIREYMNNNPAGRDAYRFLEKAVMEMIMPIDTVVVLENADSLNPAAFRDYAENLFAPEDTCFLIMTGEFSDEDLAPLAESCIHVVLPPKE